ncbi:MAG: 2'-5' RNA ligase family protein [Candidatus Saccharimonadales bacterium]
MAIDHFIKHKAQVGRTDWNFNILFNDQPQVAELVSKYAPLLQHPGLHKPVPDEWLHATVLRVGFLEEFTEAEMLAVVAKLEPKFAIMQMPKLMLGQWWLWGGNPCLHFTPDDPLKGVYDCLIEAVVAVVGEDRWQNQWSDRFMPHITLAYSKTYDDEIGLYKQLQSKSLEGVEIRANNFSLIKQQIVDDYYAWEVVKDLPIGQI